MPLNIDQQLIDELVKRQIADEDMQKRFQRSSSSSESSAPTTINPTALALLAAGLDAGTTAAFLHKGRLKEDNALFNSGPKYLPVAGAAGTGLVSLLIQKLGGKILPSNVADTVASDLSAYQMGAGSANLETMLDPQVTSAFERTGNAFATATKRKK